MKKIVLLFVLFFTMFGFSQTTYDWLNTAPDANWRQGASGARWNPGGLFDEPGFGIMRFNNNHELSMVNNVAGTYSQHQIIFGSSNTSNRTITGANIVRLFDFGGSDPKIENQSTAEHTIDFNLLGDGDAGDPLELNPVSGNLIFNSTISNQGSAILIYGDNAKTIRFNNVISGAGAFVIKQNSTAIFNATNIYTGNTEIDKGELWSETTGNSIASGSAIFLGNGGLPANVTKLFLSRTAGGSTFTRNLTINQGNATTRFVGGLNTAGTNEFSGTINHNTTSDLNIEVASSTGIVRFSNVILGVGNVIKIGSGIAEFSGTTKTYTGTTTITAGILRLVSANQIADTSNMILSGGTFGSGATTGSSETVGTLQLTANSSVALGTGNHTLTFSNSSGVSWTGATVLTVTGWSGVPGTTGIGAAGKIQVGVGGLTSGQLAQINFTGYANGAVLTATGEVVPSDYIRYYSVNSSASEVLTNWTTLRSGLGISPTNFTSTAAFIIQDTHTMTSATTWSLTGAGTLLQIESGGTLVSTFAVTVPSTGIFQVDNGGLYKHDNTTAWGSTIFAGTEVFGNSSTVEINKTNATLPNNSTYGNLTIDLTADPGATLSFGGNLTTLNGNFIIKNTQTRQVRMAAASSITIAVAGNFEVQTGADFCIVSGAGNNTLDVSGNVLLSGGFFTLASGTGAGYLITKGQNFYMYSGVTLAGLTPGASGFYFNRTGSQVLTLGQTFAAGNHRDRFFYNTTNVTSLNEFYIGSAAQFTVTGSAAVTPLTGYAAFPTSGILLSNFSVNNANGVTLRRNIEVGNTLYLTNGTITPNGNTLTIASIGTYSGGSATSHVNGNLNRVYSSNGSLVFPVGKSGVYRPVTFEYTALTGTSTVSVDQVESALTGTLPANTNLNNARTWDISQTGGSAFDYKVTLDATGDTPSGTIVMLKKESGTITSNTTTSPNYTNTTGFTTLTGINNFTLGSDCTVTTSAGSNQSLCQGTTATLAANTPLFGTGNWTVTGPSNLTSQFSSTSNPTAVFTPAGGAGVYTLTWTITNGACSNNSNVTLTFGGTSTWTGSWSPSAPTSIDAAIISANYSVAANINACTLTVDTGAVVVIPSTYNVTLNGALTVTSGSFTLNNNANLIQTTGATNSGNIIVKRNTNPLKRFDYTLWSSPVASQQLLAFSPLTSVSPTIRFYTYNTTSNLYNSVATPGSTNFATGIGYLIRLPFNHPTSAQIWTGSFTGVPNNGTQTIGLNNIGAGQRFNAIGNPFPSTINLAQFATDNSTKIESTLYYWRKTNNSASPSYCTWNTSSNTFVDNGEAYTDSPLGILQIGQGFIVEAKASATTVEFNNNQRTADNANQFFRTTNLVTSNSEEANRIWLNLTGNGSEYAQAVVGYFSNATDDVDDYDSKYFNDGPVALNTFIDDKEYIIQGKSLPFQVDDKIDLNYKVSTYGKYTFTIDHLDGLFINQNQDIYIIDNLNNVYHNLKRNPFTFKSEAGTFSDRFRLRFEVPLDKIAQNFSEASVVVYKQNDELVLNSNNMIMKSVKVFDITGRLLIEKTAIYATETQLNVGNKNQVLMVQITSTDNEVSVKKVIN